MGVGVGQVGAIPSRCILRRECMGELKVDKG